MIRCLQIKLLLTLFVYSCRSQTLLSFLNVKLVKRFTGCTSNRSYSTIFSGLAIGNMAMATRNAQVGLTVDKTTGAPILKQAKFLIALKFLNFVHKSRDYF